MLIEVKAKVARISVVDGKIRKKTETFLLDKEFFSEAEYQVMQLLSQEQASNIVDSYEIISLKQSPVKEVCTQYVGEFTYMVTLKDIFLTDDGTEKELKYKALLWANSLSEAMARTDAFFRQGYNMSVDGLKEVNYEYLDNAEASSDETANPEEDQNNE